MVEHCRGCKREGGEYGCSGAALPTEVQAVVEAGERLNRMLNPFINYSDQQLAMARECWSAALAALKGA